MQKKIIFIHGYTASPESDWYPNIKKEMDLLGLDYSIPYLPGNLHPKQEDWLKIIDQELKSSTDKSIILVGHSLGTRAILLYLTKYNIKIDSVLLIAAFNDNLVENSHIPDEDYSNFFTHPINIQKVKESSKRFVVMHSKDDSSIPYSQGVDIAEKLGAKLITYEDRDHFSSPENYSVILEVLQSLLKQ